MFVRSTHIARLMLIEGVGISGFDLIVDEVDLNGTNGKSEFSA